jgi:hypothetical protein
MDVEHVPYHAPMPSESQASGGPDAPSSATEGPSGGERREPPRTRRRWRRRLGALFLGLGLPLLALEIGVRATHGNPVQQRTPLQLVEADAATGWRMVPSRDFFTYAAPVSVNALGLRGPEVRPRVEGELRVVALGDSMVFGSGVRDDETLPARLELELEQRLGRSVTVINTGHMAYSTNQELRLLFDLGQQLDPDLVVLFWFFNDVDEVPIEARYAELLASGPQTFETRNAFTGWPAWRWRLREFARHSAILAYLRWQGENGQRGNWSADQVDAGFASLDAWAAQFAHTREALGADPLAVVLPFAAALTNDERARAHRSHAMEKRAAQIFASHGIPTFSTRPALEGLTVELGRPPHLVYDYHYDATGNAEQARAVARWMDEVVGVE